MHYAPDRKRVRLVDASRQEKHYLYFFSFFLRRAIGVLLITGSAPAERDESMLRREVTRELGYPSFGYTNRPFLLRGGVLRFRAIAKPPPDYHAARRLLPFSPSILFALATILLYCAFDRFPLSSCCFALALAFAAWLLSGIGYLPFTPDDRFAFGRPISDLGTLRRFAAVIFPTDLPIRVSCDRFEDALRFLLSLPVRRSRASVAFDSPRSSALLPSFGFLRRCSAQYFFRAGGILPFFGFAIISPFTR